MIELRTDEKQELVTKTAEATTNILTALITLRRDDLIQQQLEITKAVLQGLGILANYNLKDIAEGLTSRPKTIINA